LTNCLDFHGHEIKAKVTQQGQIFKRVNCTRWRHPHQWLGI